MDINNCHIDTLVSTVKTNSNLKCLICFSQVYSSTESKLPKSPLQDVIVKSEPKDISIKSRASQITKDENELKVLKAIDRQLNSYFLLKYVIDISSKQLEGYLQVKGDPVNWVSLCDICSVEVEKIKKLFWELQRVSRKFEEAKWMVQQNIRNTRQKDESYLGVRAGTDITRECRGVVHKRKIWPLSKLSEKQASYALWDRFALKLSREADIRSQSQLKTDSEQVTEIYPKSPANIDTHCGDDAINDTNYVQSDPSSRSVSPVHFQDSDADYQPDFSTEEVDNNEAEVENVSSNKDDDDEGHKVRKKAVVDLSSTSSGPCGERRSRKIRPKGTMFTCNLCDLKKTKMNILRFCDHIYSIHQRPYKCLKCPFGFNYLDKVSSHWFYHHREFLNDFPNLKSRFEEVTPVLPVVPWWCPACSTKFDDENLRDSHIDACGEGASKMRRCFDCDVPQCTKALFTEEELKFHKVLVHPSLFRETSFQCSECLQYFRTEKRLMVHRRSVHRLDLYKCDKCGDEFRLEVSLIKHKERNHGDNDLGEDRLKCDICSKVCTSEHHLSRHKTYQHGNKSCTICGEKCETKIKMKMHLYREHGIGKRLLLHKCPAEGCGKEIYDGASFKRHLETHNTEKCYLCSECGSSLKSQDALDKHCFFIHKITTESTRGFRFKECGYCGKRFKKYIFQMHQKSCIERRRQNELKLICQICNTHFQTMEDLRNHSMFKHAVRLIENEEIEDKLPCSSCPKQFPHQKALQRHIKAVHEHLKNYICSVCGMRKLGKADLDWHMARIHQVGVEDFKCSICEVFFKSRGAKAKHTCGVTEVKTKKKHVCKYCGNEYSTKGQLRFHVEAVHEKVYRLQCEHCKFACNKKWHLDKHLSAKHNIGKWKCEVDGCPKAFYRKNLLDEHIQYKHMGKERPRPFKCNHCTSTYMRADHLRAHINKMHPDQTAASDMLCANTT